MISNNIKAASSELPIFQGDCRRYLNELSAFSKHAGKTPHASLVKLRPISFVLQTLHRSNILIAVDILQAGDSYAWKCQTCSR